MPIAFRMASRGMVPMTRIGLKAAIVCNLATGDLALVTSRGSVGLLAVRGWSSMGWYCHGFGTQRMVA